MAIPKRRRNCLVLAVVALIGIGVVVPPYVDSVTKRRELYELASAFVANDYAAARTRAAEFLAAHEDDATALHIAAVSARMLGRHDESSEYFLRLAAIQPLLASEYLYLAEVSLEQARPLDAESYLNDALRVNPDLHEARVRLVQLLSVECRTYEALRHRRYLLQHGVWSETDLLHLAKPSDLQHAPDLDLFLQADPKNPYLLLARARHARLQNRHTDAARWLQEARSYKPDFVEAYADEGLLLLDQPTEDEAFNRWFADCPPGAEAHADVWVVRGMWAKRSEEFAAAARCFGEALLIESDHQLATYQVGIVLASLGEESLASEFAARAATLNELVRTVDEVYDAPRSSTPWSHGAHLLETLGRLHEAAAWYSMSANVDPSQVDARARASSLHEQLDETSPIVTADAHLVRKLDLDKYPLLDRPLAVASRGAVQAKRGVIQFSDVTGDLGIEFSLVGADLPVQRPRSIFEIFGAGVAVLDFDRDGWPDIYFAQTSRDAAIRSPGGSLDQLYRNLDGQRFELVSPRAALEDSDFGQGVSIGDYDNDGFPDILVANVGDNRLFRNNGDGTFWDVTADAGIGGPEWTSSCVIADLNGDSLPDLYEANYLRGQSLFEVMCDGGQDTMGLACRPQQFPAAPDRFFLNLGNGRFQESSAQAGIVAPDGKGLGVVVADFDGNGQLEVFVANDTTANHYYVNSAPRGDSPRFRERASLIGLASDRNGLTQACMGVAVDDSDGDGRLDLFVTNFYEESNTLYHGLGEHYFDDRSRETELYLPSLSLLGFGTQFVDAELDGDPDLVVANGHITGKSQDGSSFQMRPQFFENRNGQYVERRGGEIGDYFDRPLLGRAVARIDFNRDGREEFLVSHLDAPAVLMQNDSRQAGSFLGVRLAGITSDRDAIGASVTIVTRRGEQMFRQLTAGDGYQCSNQRHLVFGLGDATSVSSLIVRWPSGLEQEFSNLSANQEVLIREGNPNVIEMH